MKEYPFQFAVLRYMHDPMTEEFLNTGVVVYSREARYVKASVSTRYARLSDAFQEINGEHYRRLVSYIERQFVQMHKRFQEPRMFEDLPAQIELVTAQVLPPDDSSLVFGGYGGGLTTDLDSELSRLFGRLVERYVANEDRPSRTDQEIWNVYRSELDRHNVTARLSSVKIQTQTYSYDFDHAWKNHRWHPVEPVSFDLVHKTSILDKANRWIGRMAMLADSEEIGTLFMLLGAPTRSEVLPAYENAIHNLAEKTALRLELVQEDEAPAFSAKIARMMH